MRKILIIDERSQRQLEFLPGKQKDLDKIAQLQFVENKIFDEFNAFMKALHKGNFDELLSYELWIIHRSLLVKEKLLNEIQLLAKKHKKSLILFSGSVSTHTFSQSDFPFLIMNSKNLYSERLIPFIMKFANDEKTTLVELIYGKNWKLTYLFKYRQVLQGVIYPGNMQETTDELESILGELTIEQVEQQISETLDS
ncbi:MAG: hypothetical protein EOO20_13545 [Chryseobacterium sp.]|nr:MAG: hypothetical protein EOO20_13545 [Chryseobacterium sp.]